MASGGERDPSPLGDRHTPGRRPGNVPRQGEPPCYPVTPHPCVNTRIHQADWRVAAHGPSCVPWAAQSRERFSLSRSSPSTFPQNEYSYSWIAHAAERHTLGRIERSLLRVLGIVRQHAATVTRYPPQACWPGCSGQIIAPRWMIPRNSRRIDFGNRRRPNGCSSFSEPLWLSPQT